MAISFVLIFSKKLFFFKKGLNLRIDSVASSAGQGKLKTNNRCSVSILITILLKKGMEKTLQMFYVLEVPYTIDTDRYNMDV
jgi:hypothetical protein